MGMGRKPDRVYDLEGRRLTGQPTKDLLARARAWPGRTLWAYRRPGPGGWWEYFDPLADVPYPMARVRLVVVR